MSTHVVETEADVRQRQTWALRTLTQRLERGDQLLPADLMANVLEELELRIDEEAVAAAWAEQTSGVTTAWRGEAARAIRRARGRDVREIFVLEQAQRTLASLDIGVRDELSLEIDALAFDPSPRGSVAMHGRKEDHMQLRVGKHRLLYKVEPGAVVVVAVTCDEER